jgi:CRP/FNR family cyclic AMP-dependent transcriptional regulator
LGSALRRTPLSAAPRRPWPVSSAHLPWTLNRVSSPAPLSRHVKAFERDLRRFVTHCVARAQALRSARRQLGMNEQGNLVNLLKANPFFGGLQPPALEAIAALCVPRHLDAGETLFLKGDEGDALYAVRRGRIRIATGTEAGRRLTLNLLGAGDVFGEVALLDGRSRTADAIAAEPSELFMVYRRDFVDLLERQPQVAMRIIELLCERIRWMSDRMEETALLPLPARLAQRLLAMCDDYGAELDISQEELAVFVCASRERVNRQLQTWRRQGFVDLGRNHIRVLDRAQLDQVRAAS